MGTTVKDLLVAARSKIAAVAVSRSVSEFFIEHLTNQPFDATPISKRDGFEVVARNIELTSAFGLAGQKEGRFDMVLRLGHAPAGTDKLREEYLAQDITRLSDILEVAAWPDGLSSIFFVKATTDKEKNPNWWITEMFFNVVYTGDIQS